MSTAAVTPPLARLGRTLRTKWAQQPRPLVAWLDSDEAIHPRRLLTALWPTRKRTATVQASDLLRLTTAAPTEGMAPTAHPLTRAGIVMVLGFERLTRAQQLELGPLFRGGALGPVSIHPQVRLVVLQQREAVEPELPFELAIRQFPVGTLAPTPDDPAWQDVLCPDAAMAAARLAAMAARAAANPELAELLAELPDLVVGPGARRRTYPPPPAPPRERTPQAAATPVTGTVARLVR